MKTITYDETEYKLVPLEPIEEMSALKTTGLHWQASEAIYKAMLAAAPKVEAVGAEPAGRCPYWQQLTAAQARISELGEALIGCLSDAFDTDEITDLMQIIRANARAALSRTDNLGALKAYRRKVLEEAAGRLTNKDGNEFEYWAGLLRRMAQEDI